MTRPASTTVFKGLLAACALSCSSPQSPPPKPPTNDVQPPATTTGNGEVMGADRVSPAEKLQQSVKVDSNKGVQPAAQPPGE